MKITVTFFAQLAQDVNGTDMPMGRNKLGHEELEDVGAAAPAPAGATLVRVATDTDVTVDAYGDSDGLLLPGGSVEWFPVEAAQVLTFA